MKIFWSWQSDRDPKLHHYFVRDALKDACKLIASELEYSEAVRPEVDHDTKGVAGTPDITTTILDKIAEANVFVADMTPVGMTNPEMLLPNTSPEDRPGPKYLQNPNVMSELGYAERALGQNRILLVANKIHYPGAEALPFDWRHRSGAKTFRLSDGATAPEIMAERKRFAEVLKTCIGPILATQRPKPAPPPEIDWQSSSKSNSSAWWETNTPLEFKNDSLRQNKRAVQFTSGALVCARIAPTYWSAPPRVSMEQRISEVRLNIRASSGDWGLNSAGALLVWGNFDDKNLIASNAVQWFQKTGEIWGLSAGGSHDLDSGRTFHPIALFPPLDYFIKTALEQIRALGGKGPFGVRLEANGLMGTTMPGTYQFEKHDALQDRVEIREIRDEWPEDARHQILRKFWDALYDSFGQLTSTDIEDFKIKSYLKRP